MIGQAVADDPRALNRLVLDQEMDTGALVLQGRPTRVWFALTGRCNLACLHCPRIAGVSSDVDMEPELFARVRDEVMVNAEEVDFGGNNLGEQMIHPDFFKALAQIREAGCRVLLTTNGTKLNDDTAASLARHGVRLRISVEGMGATYEQIRRVSWEKLMNGLRAFQRAAHEHHEAHATLEFAMSVFADNLNQLPELVATAKELGADRVFAQHLLPKNNDQKLQSLFFHRKAANETFARTEKLGTELGIEVRLPDKMDCGSLALKKATDEVEVATPTLDPCYLPWTSVNILENGDVLPCCVAGGSLIMGNLKKTSFQEVWNGPAYQRLRKTVNSKRPPKVCAECNMRGGSAKEETFEILLDQHSVAGRVKTGIKQYLLRTKRKKTLARLVRARDTVNRILARV